MNWHLEPAVVHRYAAGQLGASQAASVDAHMTACGACRALAAGVADGDVLDRVKAGIDARIDMPPITAVERVARRLGVGTIDARIVAVTFTLLGSWLGASVLALSFAVVASAAGSERGGFAAFLVLAPLVPVAGVALAFGPRVDPAYEMAAAAPVPSTRIVLLRSLVVIGSALPAIALLSLALPGWSALAFAWLLPSLGLTAAALALGTVVAPARAAVGLGALWLVGAGVGLAGAPRSSVETFVEGFAAFRPAGQALFAVVAVLSVVMLSARHTAYEVAR
jgi:hypothetical protein